MENNNSWKKGFSKTAKYLGKINEIEYSDDDNQTAYLFEKFLPVVKEMSKNLSIEESEGADVLTKMLVDRPKKYKHDINFANLIYLRLLNEKSKIESYNDRFDHYLNNDQRKEGKSVIENFPDSENQIDNFISNENFGDIFKDYNKNKSFFNKKEQAIVEKLFQGYDKEEILGRSDDSEYNSKYNKLRSIGKKFFALGMVTEEEKSFARKNTQKKVDKNKLICKADKVEIARLMTQKHYSDVHSQVLQCFIDCVNEEEFVERVSEMDLAVVKSLYGHYMKYLPSSKLKLKNAFRMIHQGLTLGIKKLQPNNYHQNDSMDEIGAPEVYSESDKIADNIREIKEDMPVWLL